MDRFPIEIWSAVQGNRESISKNSLAQSSSDGMINPLSVSTTSGLQVATAACLRCRLADTYVLCGAEGDLFTVAAACCQSATVDN